MRPVRLALLGAGRIGRLHAEALRREVLEAELVAICDPSLDRAWARGLGVELVAGDPAAVFSDPAIEAVVIAAPSTLHAELAIAAARAGKHVFCEKPLSFDIARAAEVESVRRSAGVILQVGFNRRFDRDIRRLRDEVRRGAIGALNVIEIVSRDPALPSFEFLAASGGLFFDFTIHDFDVVRFVSGDEIASVFARGTARVEPRLREIGDLDSAIVTLRLCSGAFAVIVDGRQSACGYDQRFEAFGNAGALAVENLRADALVRSDTAGVLEAKPRERFLERYRDAYVEEFRAFCRAVRAGEEAEVGVADLIAALRASNAAVRSLAEGRAVELAEIAAGVAP